MRHLILLLFTGTALAYNPYLDYMLCRFYQEKEPQRARMHCFRALEKAPTPTLYADIIRFEMKIKGPDRALRMATEFKSKYPSMPEPYLLLFSIYTLKGEHDKALRALEEGQEKNPDSKEILQHLVEEYLKRGDLAKAKRTLHEIAKINPDNPLPYYMLARVALLEGNQEEAIDFLQESLKINPTFPASFMTLGSLYEQRGEHSKAENLYKEVLNQDQTNRNALERLANLYTTTGRHAEARAVYRRLVKLYPEANYLYQYSLALIRTEEFQEARKILQELYENNPEDPDVAYTYAMLLEFFKETDKALEIYTNLRKKLGNNPKIIERLAGIYIDKKEYRKAEELLDLGLSAEPNSFQLNLLKSHLLSEMERQEEALSYAEKAIHINQKDHRGYFLRAVIHDRMGKIHSAENDLRRALELKPDDPELLNHLGYSLLLWYEGARLAEAELLIKRALEKEPENPAYIDSMAWVLYYKGEYEAAYKLLLRALEKEKEDPVIHEHIGDVLSKLGKEAEAQSYYRKAYELLNSGKRGEPNQKERLKSKLKGI